MAFAGSLAAPTLAAAPALAPAALPVADLNLDLNLSLSLDLRLTADPTQVEPGDVLTYTVTLANAGDAALTAVVLTDTLPAGLVYVAGSAVGFAYDPRAQQLTWPIATLAPGATLTGSFQARVQGAALGATVTNTVLASSPALAEVLTASAVVDIVPPCNDAVWATPNEGGLLRSTDDRLLLRIPPGAVQGGTRFSYTAQIKPPRPLIGLQFAFTVDAQDASGQPQHRFAAPLVLTLTYRPEEFAAAAGLPVVYYFDETTGQWTALPTQVDRQRRQLQVAVAHLTLFAVAASQDEGKVTGLLAPTVLGAGPDLWTGDAGFSDPLELPPGPGGLAPGLSLSYNGGGVNDMVRQVGSSAHDVQAGFAGLGWAVGGLGAITKVDDAYYLSFAGGSYELVLTSGSTWHTVPESFLRIEHPQVNRIATWEAVFAGCHAPTPFLGQATIRYTNTDPWTVWTPDGTRYGFGSAVDSLGQPTLPGATPYRWGGSLSCGSTCYANQGDHTCGGSVDATPFEWNLVRVTDPNANQVNVTYGYADQAIAGSTAACPSTYEVINGKRYIRESYPASLSYGGGTVNFISTTRSDQPEIGDTTCSNQKVWRDKALGKVSVQAAGQPVRSYQLTYSTQTHLRLDSVRLLGPLEEPLPIATSFTYTQTGSGPNTQFLYTVSNGQGGGVTLRYGTEAANIPNPWPGNGCQSGDRYVVSERRLASGSGADTLSTYDYGSGASSGTCQANGRYEFLGFDVVTQTVRLTDTTAVAQQMVTWFHQKDTAGNPDVRKGKKWRETVGDGATVLQETTWSWVAEGYWPKLASNTTLVNGVGHRTEYFYDADDHQGNAQYGNVTRIKEYRDAGATLYRTTERWYYPNVDTTNGKYIVNRVAQEKLWEGEATSGVCRSQARYVYNNTGAGYTTPPTTGLLYKVRQMTSVCDDTGVAPGWVVTQYNYDSRGNRTQVIAPNNTLTTTTTYDSVYTAYPLTVTAQPGPNLGPALTTAYRYYGVNQESGGFGLVGQLQTSTDPNGAITRSTYDAFGRLIEVRRPGAGWSHAATEQYTYTVTAPFTVKHGLKDDALSDAVAPGVATYLEDWTFYDGLGQVVQTQAEAGQSNNAIVVNHRYNALGLVISQTLPYVVSVAPGAYQTPDWSQPQTQTRYDALGRTTVITNPAGAAVNTFYNGRQTAVLDELRHQTLATVDAFGRLSSSQQYSGTFTSPNWSTPAYATALYTYTVRDQLSGLAGADNATTTITYDLAGRKTQMSDPDMGTWYYGYDDLGNLKYQIDAIKTNNLWRATCFYYDGHNRLKGKTYPTGIASPTSYSCPADPGVYTSAYAYDSTAGGNAGLGRRTAMTDASGSAAWVYDGRGRVTQETKIISGGGTFVTRWGYDSADRVQSQTYPGGSGGQVGEVVTNTYNARGLLKTVSGASVYVTNTWYNPAGQVTDRMLGSTGAVRQNYSYSQANNFRLTTLKSGVYPTNTTSLQNVTYGYDAAGNVLSIADAAAFGGSQTQSFSYDDLNRLKTASASGTPPNYGAYNTVGYAYSPAGNLTSFESTSTNRYYKDAAHPHAVTHLNGEAPANQQYWYDANGNATRRINAGQTITMTYDAENRLTGMSGAATETHSYDGDGVRVRAVITTPVSMTSIYVGNYFEITSGITRTYYYAGNVRVAERYSNTLYYLLTDHLGSTAVTTDASGNRVTELRYYPYGGDRYNGTNQKTTYRFTGQRWDPGTALYFYGSRWYDPVVGRFLQADTLVPQPGNPQALNRYSYAANNPVKFTDPTGHFSPEAIEAYLKQAKPDAWAEILKSWQTDKEWWGLLQRSRSGDILTRVQEDRKTIEHYQFTGTDHEVLGGLQKIGQPGNEPEPLGEGDLMDVFANRGAGVGVFGFDDYDNVIVRGAIGLNYRSRVVSGTEADIKAGVVGVFAWSATYGWGALAQAIAAFVTGYGSRSIGNATGMTPGDNELTISYAWPRPCGCRPPLPVYDLYTFRGGSLADHVHSVVPAR